MKGTACPQGIVEMMSSIGTFICRELTATSTAFDKNKEMGQS